MRAIFFVLALAGCSQGPLSMQWGSSGSGDGLSTGLQNGYSDQAMAVFTQNCTQCHGTASGPGGVYDLTDLNHLVSSGLVIPGDPSGSQLYTAISSGAMPPSGRLNSADQQVIENWIAAATASSPTPTPGPTPRPTPTPTPSPVVSFQTLEAQIFEPKCVSCHAGTGGSAGYHFDSYIGVMRAVNLTSPASSLVYTVTSRGAMPPSSANRLTSQQEAMLLTWIQQGAKNN